MLLIRIILYAAVLFIRSLFTNFKSLTLTPQNLILVILFCVINSVKKKMAELSLGILIDIVDEDWMRDTLPQDGIFFLSLSS